MSSELLYGISRDYSFWQVNDNPVFREQSVIPTKYYGTVTGRR